MIADAQAPGHFAFAHGIVRDAIREALPAQRRGALHEAVASALIVRRDAGADVPAAQIAHHALAAARAGADPQPAWDAALEAAREAAAALGHAEAAGALRARRSRRSRSGAEAPAAERRDALLALADATFAAGDIEDGAPPLRAGRGRRAPRRRRRGARARRARVRAGAPVRRGRRARA